MKKINFITSLSPQKQYEIRRWFYVTLFLFLCSIILSLYFLISPLVTYISLKNEINTLRDQTKNYSDIIKKKDTLKTEYELIRSQLHKINRYDSGVKNPYLYFTAIENMCNNEIKLESIMLNKKDCTITIVCSTSGNAAMYIQRLSDLGSLFTKIKLVSLHYDPQLKQFRSVIKSMITV
ncbi:MAG TPA: hypothetical protein VLB80_03455 [Candidatus Babeliales bacterium]|nr:hypothetical protein [Candidatus Babeliales bacterium]